MAGLLSVAGLPFAAAPASAQELGRDLPLPRAPDVETTNPDALAGDDAVRVLDAWIEEYASRARTPRIVSGVAGLVVGIGVVPVEIWALTEIRRRDTTTLTLAGLGLGLALIDIALGIVALARPSLQEERLERWRAMRAAGPISARALGRFEGEIRAEVAAAESARWTSLAVGIAVFLAGGVALGMTAAFARDDWQQLAGYLAAGVLGAGGAVLAVAPWLDWTPEHDWDAIESGTAPQLSCVPWLSPQGGGLALNGTF